MFMRIRNAFIGGTAVIVPIALTIAIVRYIVITINSWILNPLINLFTPYITDTYARYAAKFGIFVLSIFLICFIGWTAKILVIRKFFGTWEKVFLKIPMLGKIYNALKEISTAFIGQGKTVFKQVVLVEYPRKGLYSIGFITGDAKGELQVKKDEEVFSVFIPTTPNPTSGVFLLIPKSELKFSNISVEAGMKMIISGGAVTPAFKETKENVK